MNMYVTGVHGLTRTYAGTSMNARGTTGAARLTTKSATLA